MKRELGAVQVAAELSLLGVTLAAVFGFARLFTDNDFGGPLVTAAIGSHVVAAITRRLGWSIGRAAIVSIVAMGLVITWSMFWDTSFFGVPTPDTLDAVSSAGDQAWAEFREVVAPAPTLTGFVLALFIGIWAGAFLADWAAFRLWSPIEAIVPMTALFVFAALLGEDTRRTSSTVLFIVAVTAFELLHRVARQAREGRWVNDDIDRGINALVTRGAVLGLGAIAVGSILAPSLPQADAPPVIDWRGAGGGDSERVEASPLVNIQDRLVEQSNLELFTVRAEEPAYWRLTSLDIFNGQFWGSDGTFEKASGTLPLTAEGEPSGTPITQSYAIDALSSPWLPAAYEPRSFSSDSTEAVYEARSGTLIVPKDRDNADGAEYTIESIRPSFDLADLRAGVGPVPDEIADQFLQLPDDFSRIAAEEAELRTAAGETPYDKAVLLQDWFRTEFQYDLDVDLAHDMNAMEAFLDEKRGYCQQFAGTYAAMARSLGIPSRVAVGFTWGEQDPVDPALWHVSGRQAHAWVEVYIAGTGWVDFDPTPGRAAPGSAAWTGHDQQQDVSQRSAEPNAATTTTSIAAAADTPAEQAEEEVATTPDEQAPEGTGGSGQSGETVIPVIAGGVLALLLLLAAAGGVVALVKTHRSRSRRRLLADLIDESEQAHDATAGGSELETVDTRAGVQAAWEEIVDRLGVLGLTEQPTETQTEFIDRAVELTELDPTGPERLAASADQAESALQPPPLSALDDARSTIAVVDDHVYRSTTGWERFQWFVDPRSLFPGHSGHESR